MKAITKEKAPRTFDLKKLLKWAFIVGASGLGIYALIAIIIACVAPQHLHVVIQGNLFTDFAETLSFAFVPNPYTGAYGGIRTFYPPLSFLILWPFTLFCSGKLNAYTIGEAGSKISLAELSADPGFICAFLLYFLINLAIVMYVAARMSKLKGKDLFYLLGLIVCCGPLVFEFVRANNTLTTFVFVLLFFYFNGSKDGGGNKIWRREISYIFLALAICTKIYPALIIPFLIWKEKGWNKLWAVLKTIVYTAAVVFLPFLLIEGGFGNISAIWNNFRGFSTGSPVVLLKAGGDFWESLGGHAGDYLANSVKWGSNVSIETITFYFCYLLSLIFGGANLSMMQHIVAMILRYGLLVIAFVLPFFSFKSKKYKEFVTLAIGSYMLFPGVCNGYCLTLMILPFILTILDWNNMSLKDKIFYGICYGLLMFAPLYSYAIFILSSTAMFAIVVKSIVDIIKDDVLIFKTARKEKLEIKENKEEKSMQEKQA